MKARDKGDPAQTELGRLKRRFCVGLFSLSSPRKTEPKLIILGLFSAHRRKDGKGGRKTFSSLAQRMERERVRFLATWNGVKEDER